MTGDDLDTYVEEEANKLVPITAREEFIKDIPLVNRETV
jgi:hypothetical protein